MTSILLDFDLQWRSPASWHHAGVQGASRLGSEYRPGPLDRVPLPHGGLAPPYETPPWV